MTEKACYHCGLPVPSGTHFTVSIDGAEREMCCPGCQAVAVAIVDGGLERFYRYRTEASERPDETEMASAEWQMYDLPDIQADFVSPGEGKTRRAHLLLEGITCAACSWLIEEHMKRYPAVQALSVDVTTHRCTLTWDEEAQPLSELLAGLAQVGYRPRPATDEERRAFAQQENRSALLRLGVAGFGMMQASMVAVGMYSGAVDEWKLFLRWLSFLVATPVVLFSAFPFFQAAWRSLKARKLIMDVPVALAIGLAYLASAWATITGRGDVYFESIAMFTFFLLVGRYLEMRTRHRNRLAYGNLAQLMPLSATRLNDDGVERIPVKALREGDRVRVRSGETFPCDGTILSGHSDVVEALLTGESRPVPRGPGDPVVGGTLNGESDLEVSVTATGAQTQLSAIERLVAQAETEKPHQVALADKVARYFVGAVLIIFIGVWGGWQWIDPERAFWVALSVLVVTCPCALALAMPTALTAATANLRRQGFLVARGHVLEALSSVDRVFLDKTGTLTLGQFSVASTIPLIASREDDWLLSVAGALEAPARHPLAVAFRPWADRFEATDTHQYTGAGVEGVIEGVRYRLGHPAFAAEGLSGEVPPLPDGEHLWLLLADQKQPLGWFALEDQVRPGAVDLVNTLQRQGIGVEMLSGDQSGAVAALARALGMKNFCAGARPEDKLRRLQKAQARGDRVMMVGDGINDVPVLSAANVSVAMATASDLAQTRADAVLLNSNLSALRQALHLGRRTRTIIRQNLGLSLGYNLLALPLAASGLIPPWLAAIGMTTSSLLVVFNALRLHRVSSARSF